MAEAPLNEMMGRLQALQSPFLMQSKEIFASDLADDPQYPGWVFALPLLSMANFLEAAPDEVDRWFSFFGVYLRESPEDKGMLLASKGNLEEDLEQVLDQMREEGARYPV